MSVEAELALELLGRGESICFRARGGSMRPFVRDGDVVTVAPGAVGVGLGTVVLAPVGDFGCVHRVVWRRGHQVLVKGDAFPHSDGWFDERELLGQVVGVKRTGRDVRQGRWLPVVVSAVGGLARRHLWRRRRRLERRAQRIGHH